MFSYQSSKAIGSVDSCFVILQDSYDCLNTGFLVFSLQEDKTRVRFTRFVDRWIRHWFEIAGIWDGDQVAFEYTLMDEAQRYSNLKETGIFDCRFGDAHGAQLCLFEFFTSINLHHTQRSFSDVCVIWRIRENTKLSWHDRYVEGDFLLHGRKNNAIIPN